MRPAALTKVEVTRSRSHADRMETCHGRCRSARFIRSSAPAPATGLRRTAPYCRCPPTAALSDRPAAPGRGSMFLPRSARRTGSGTGGGPATSARPRAVRLSSVMIDHDRARRSLPTSRQDTISRLRFNGNGVSVMRYTTMRTAGLFSSLLLVGVTFGVPTASTAAVPTSAGLATALSEDGATPVDFRPYRHCHWDRYGRRWCHGGPPPPPRYYGPGPYPGFGPPPPPPPPRPFPF
jgi:hypothetical protein